MNTSNLIIKTLREQYEVEKSKHISSGKLSAGQLGKPLLEQTLKIIGVPGKTPDDYTLRLFARGKQVEQWLCSILPGEEQVEVEYKNVVGVIDKLQDYPIEIKSVKSSQWAYLKQPKWSHKLQAGLYALAVNSDKYKVIYVTADDFRTKEFEERTSDIKEEIEDIVGEVQEQLKKAVLPPFEAREAWQENSKYSNYPDWRVDEDLLMEKLKQYPEAYHKLTTGSDLQLDDLRSQVAAG